MSEKQLKFTLESDRQYIGIFDGAYALTGFEVCNLLNSLYQQCEALQNENEQLNKRNKFLEEFDGRAKTVANLNEENEQLRQAIDNIYDSYRNYYGMSLRNADWLIDESDSDE